MGLVSAIGVSGCSESPQDTPVPIEDSDAADGGGLELPTGAEIDDAASQAVDAVSERATAAWEKASSAMKDFEGAREMLPGIKDMYSSAKAAVSQVTSEEAAQKAKVELDQLSVNIDAWKPQLAEMSADAKVAAKGFFIHVAEQLNVLVQKLEENQWVQEILKPKLEQMVAQLRSLVG
jgi:hypothetical protein